MFRRDPRGGGGGRMHVAYAEIAILSLYLALMPAVSAATC